MVSVIIPNFNHAAFLDERISSILNQSFQDFELLILDDCSIDNSREIIEKYRHSEKVSHIVYNELNSGSPFNQWDKGIKLAKGEIIWIAESDDYCEPTLLSTLMEGFNLNRNCTLSYCQSIMIGPEDNVIWKTSHSKMEDFIQGNLYIKKFLVNENSIINASMVLFKKECYIKISNNFKNYKFCGDWLCWSEIIRQGEVYVSGKYLNYFRKHEMDVSGKAYSTGLNFIEEIKVLQSLEEKGLINLKEYRKGLLFKYFKYRIIRAKFSSANRTRIEYLFSQYKGKPYQNFLSLKYFILRLKNLNNSLFFFK